jgi:predicted PurR-regulated permease PerM
LESVMILNSKYTGWWIAGVGCLLVYLLSPVLAPFVAGALFAYLGDPWVDRLERIKHVSRTSAVLAVFAAMALILLAVLLLLIPTIQSQFVTLFNRIPGDIQRLREAGLPFLGVTPAQLQHWLDVAEWKRLIAAHGEQAGGVAAVVVDYVSQSGKAIVSWVLMLFVVPVVAFYLLRDWDEIVADVRRLLPRRTEAVVVALANEADLVLGAFLRGQLTVMTALALIYSVGLSLVGVDGAFALGFMAGMISFVPYVGAIAGVLVAGLATLIQFQDGLHIMYVLVVFGVGHVLESMVLTPLLLGDKIGLHPVAVIFAVLVGEHLFGFVGVLLALPVAAVVMVLLRHGYARYVSSEWYAQGVIRDRGKMDAGGRAE